MSLEDIVNLTISRTSRTPSRPGFGIPLLVVSKVPATWGPNRVRQFSTLKEMTDAGFLVNDPAYLMATAVKSQSPAPTRFKIARRLLQATPTVTLVIASVPAPAVGDVYTVTVDGTPITFTAGAAPTTTTVAAGIAALIVANRWTAGAAAGVVTLTAALGVLPTLSAWSRNLIVTDTTADPGLATDLANINAEDTAWYGLLLDSQSRLQVLAAAAFVEANKKLFVFDSSDSNTMDPAVTTDVFSALKTLTYFRTAGISSPSSLNSGLAAAWIGNRFPSDPSQAPDAGGTWAFKTLAGVPVQTMSDGQITAILNKNGSVYTVVAGIPVTQFGKTAGGEWIDVIRFLDWLESEIKIRVFTHFASRQRVPFTDNGVLSIVNVIKGTLAAGVTAGGLASDPPPEVTAPLVADVSAIDRALRNLPNVAFTVRLSGAIHAVNVTGSVGV